MLKTDKPSIAYAPKMDDGYGNIAFGGRRAQDSELPVLLVPQTRETRAWVADRMAEVLGDLPDCHDRIDAILELVGIENHNPFRKPMTKLNESEAA